MEHTNNSYAKRNVFSNKYKRTKIFGMILFLIISIITILSFLPFINAIPIVWGTQYQYDDFNALNTTLWTYVTSQSGGASPPDYGYYILTATGGIMTVGATTNRGGTASASATSISFPNYLTLQNLTLIVNISAYCNNGVGGLCDNPGSVYFQAFGTSVIGLTSDIPAKVDQGKWDLVKNANNTFNVYNDGVYNKTIIPSNNLLVFVGGAYTSNPQNMYNYLTAENLYYVYDNMTMDITLLLANNSRYYYTLNNSITFNISTSTSINNLSNITLYVDSILNETKTISGTSNITTFNKFLALGPHTWNVYVCDDAGNCKFSDTNTVLLQSFNNTNVTYNPSTYETQDEYFILNAQADGLENLSAVFNYGGTYYSVNKTGNDSNALFISYIDIPAVSGITTKYFNWTVYYGTSPFPTQTYNQTVNPIYFTYCNSTTGFNYTYFNVTYRDEMPPYSFINASVRSASFNYWIGNGAVTKSYYYTSYTWVLFPNEAPSTSFCFYPFDKNININYVYKAGSTGYITRTFNSIVNFTLSNTTGTNTYKTFYLIQSADSGPVTIQVVDLTSGNVISGARVTITRDILGETVTILDGYTDDAGTIATYLSDIVSYTITASKTGCGTNTKTITPVGSYNIQLNCGGNLTPYSSYINGVTYQHSPNVGISNPGNIIYSYFVSSIFTPIISARFELWDDEGMVAYNDTNVSSGYSWCNSKNCSLTLQYYTGCADNIKGRYYINLGNATNYTNILLEKDAFWKYICINQNNSQQSWKKATNDFQAFMAVWGGGQQTNCIVYNTRGLCNNVSVCKWVNSTEYSTVNQSMVNIGICVLKDEVNKMEFNRILIIFFGMVIILFILGRGIGYEMTNPGSFVMYMAIMIVILSMAGMFTFSGLTPWEWFNQYIYAYICITLAAGYNLSIIRRYSA